MVLNKILEFEYDRFKGSNASRSNVQKSIVQRFKGSKVQRFKYFAIKC